MTKKINTKNAAAIENYADLMPAFEIPTVEENAETTAAASVEENTATEQAEMTAAAVNLKKTAKMQKARAKAHKTKARAKAKAEKAAMQAAIAAITLPYKGGRWVKVHRIGATEYTPANNVMDIASSDGATITAQATYTANTRNFEKAAYWLFRYLGHAEATTIISAAKASVEEKAKNADKDTTEVKASGDGWKCEITKIAKGQFKTQIQWQRKKAA